ncbi:hypothetical protein [Porphyromonas sp. COT-239 OH1446]|uniref:hypothetical protein n=1 Tax=Porphyromonas sp. COT-239 OH1446 TaxID=1515613 RepID=UPI00126A2A51|nr:hypothetical protein [Porphyromonas sp. COT-239 OH1446]
MATQLHYLSRLSTITAGETPGTSPHPGGLTVLLCKQSSFVLYCLLALHPSREVKHPAGDFKARLWLGWIGWMMLQSISAPTPHDQHSSITAM